MSKGAVSAASGVQHAAEVQQVQSPAGKAKQSANNSKSGPEDTVTISSQAHAAQKANQAPKSGGKK